MRLEEFILPDWAASLPANEDPLTYRAVEVSQLLEKAAYIPLFSVHNPAVENRAVYSPWFPFVPVAVEVNEQTHRFKTDVVQGTGGNLQSNSDVGGPVGKVHIRWTVMPNDFEPAPDRMPPPRPIIPFIQQRFTMLDGRFELDDGRGSGFHGFGAGHTFPAIEGQHRRLRIGAVVEVLEAFGQTSGLKGAGAVNGWIQPPGALALNILVRLMDPSGSLVGEPTVIPPIQPIANPDPDASYLFFLAEVDEQQPISPIFDSRSRFCGLNIHQVLRLVDIDYNVSKQSGIRTHTAKGRVVGGVRSKLFLNVYDRNQVTPCFTRESVFSFTNQSQEVIGTMRADLFEGRAIRTEFPGFAPIYRVAGFGPVREGTGQFEHAQGLLSTNGALSTFPAVFSNLYVLRLFDPKGTFRSKIQAATR